MADPTVIIDTQPQSVLAAIGASASFTVTAHASDSSAISYQWLKDGAAISGATSSTYTIAIVAPEDSNVYSCLVSCTVGSNIAMTSRVVLASSLIDNIELQMKILMLGMAKTCGYNFDWKSVNQEDQARETGYPRALIESPQETNLDDTNGAAAEMYTNEVTFIIWIIGLQLIDSIPNPNFTIRSYLRLAEDDLKKLFGTNLHVNGTCDVIMFRGALIVKGDKNDVQKPATLRTQWLVRYSQDRQLPREYASS